MVFIALVSDVDNGVFNTENVLDIFSSDFEMPKVAFSKITSFAL